MRAKTIASALLHQNGRRLDCGPYMSGGPETKHALGKLRAAKVPLSSVTQAGAAGIFNGGRHARRYVTEAHDGVPFLGSTDILMGDLSGVPRVAASQAVRDRGQLLEPSWSLITRSGTVGRMAFSRPDMRGMMASEHVLRVAADPKRIPPGYLHAYLRSKFGVPLIVSSTYGAIIQHIEPHHIAELPVPRLGHTIEGRANDLVVESAKLLAKYQADLNAATKQLFSSVRLDDITAADWHLMGRDTAFVVDNPHTDSLRALNFAPRYQRLLAEIRKRPWKTLGDICLPGTLRSGGRFKRVDADPEFSYRLVGQKEIFWVRPEGRWIARATVGNTVLVPRGTVMLAAQGTLGESELYCRAEFIYGRAEENAYSQHFVRAIADESVMLRGCLFAFLRSETAFRMLRSISIGTKLQDLHPKFRAELPVPYPAREAQAAIHRIVVEAYSARDKAVLREEEAVSLVEEAIEKGAS
ncbi:restriction endonuclease subunit S [Myxococcus sp. CA056]|uniref:methylation-associated defense system restriction endonuclease subunit S MAD5 n=1 Tax=Myxococcus sp. CA056 TaxID=2741740 RepID=UPI00157B8307|nr:restriction endonuclease subunit S [Myxococcus sp. CA056]NTX13532.1 restriction endonuclease subunit S [Myxococcus sp. CA056]